MEKRLEEEFGIGSAWRRCINNETTRSRRKADEQTTNTGPLVYRVKLAVVCYRLYGANLRGTQNTRTSSTDITLSNILY